MKMRQAIKSPTVIINSTVPITLALLCRLKHAHFSDVAILTSFFYFGGSFKWVVPLTIDLAPNGNQIPRNRKPPALSCCASALVVCLYTAHWTRSRMKSSGFKSVFMNVLGWFCLPFGCTFKLTLVIDQIPRNRKPPALTLFLPALGGISPYMSITCQQIV